MLRSFRITILLVLWAVPLFALHSLNATDITIRNSNELRDFTNSRTKEVQGNLSVVASQATRASDPDFFNLLPQAFRFLEKVAGDLTIRVPRLQAEELVFRRLQSVGGELSVQGCRTVNAPLLSLISGNLILTDTLLTNIRLPGLKTIEGDLTLENRAEKFAFPRLELIGGQLDVTDNPELEIIDFPRLTEITGHVEVGVAADLNALKRLQMPKLKSTGNMRLYLPQTIIRPVLWSLETVTNDLWLRGKLTLTPRLREVFKRFLLDPRTGHEPINLYYPNLQYIGESFNIAANEELTGIGIEAPRLSEARAVNSSFRLEYLRMPALKEVHSISIRTRTFDLSALEAVSALRVMALEPGIIKFPALKEVRDDFTLISHLEPNYFEAIEAPKLIAVPRLGNIDARRMIFPKLMGLTSEVHPVLSFIGDHDELDFRSLTALRNLSFQEGHFKNLNFSGLSTLNILEFEGVEVSGDIRIQGLEADVLKIVDSKMSSRFFEGFDKIRAIGIRGMEVTNGSIEFNQLEKLDVLEIGVVNPTTVRLPNLKSVGGLQSRFKLRFSGAITDLYMPALERVFDLKFDLPDLKHLNLEGLKVGRELDITAGALETITLSQLQQVEELLVTGTPLRQLDLSTVKGASKIDIRNHPNMVSINLSSLASLGRIDLHDMPLLGEVITTTPGVEGGLKATVVSASNLLERETDINCDPATLTITYFPAIQKRILGCYGGQPRVMETIEYIQRAGTPSSFDDTGTIYIDIRNPSLNFREDRTEETFRLTNDGRHSVALDLVIPEKFRPSFSLSTSQLTLAPGEEHEVAVTFNPEVAGNTTTDIELITGDISETAISLSSHNPTLIQMGEVSIDAGALVNKGNNIYAANGAILNNILRLTGPLEIDLNEGRIEGNGNISLYEIRRFGASSGREYPVYLGPFSLDLKNDNQFTTNLSEGTNLFELAEIPVLTGDMELRPDTVIFSATMTLPDDFGNQDLGIGELIISKDHGVSLEGAIPIPGEIEIGPVEFENFFITFNTQQNEFGGGGTLETKIFEAAAEVNLQRGELKDLSLTISPEKPIVLGATGWSILEGRGAVRNLNQPVPELSLTANLTPTVIQNFPLLQIEDLGLTYKFGERLTGAGKLTLLGNTLAEAKIQIDTNRVSASGRVNFDDVLKGEVGFSIGYQNNEFDLRGLMSASLTIPDKDRFFYQWIKGFVDLPYTVAATEARLDNNVLTGQTQIAGFGLKYGLAYVDSGFEFDLARLHKSLNEEFFGNNGSSQPRHLDLIAGDRIEGKSIILNQQSTSRTAGPIAHGTAEIEESFTISRELEDIFIRVQHETILPEYTITLPDGTVVTPANAQAFNGIFIQSETATKQSFYAFRNPPLGNWQLSISSENSDYLVDIVGADPVANISLGAPQLNEATIDITWETEEENSTHVLHLYYDNNDEGFDGTIIARDLNPGLSSFIWNTDNLPTGQYWVYAFLEHVESGAISAVYSTPIAITAEGALDPPENLEVKNNDLSLGLGWEAVEGADGYRVYFAENIPNFSSESFFTASDTLDIEALAPGKTYFFSVSALTGEGLESQLSAHASIDYVSQSVNNAPGFTISPPLLAKIGENYNLTLTANDPENDPISFDLINAPEGMTLEEDAITWIPEPNQTGSHPVLIYAIDSLDNFDELAFSITVDRPNLAPTDIFLTDLKITENTPASTWTTNLAASDLDETGEPRFELVEGEGDTDNALFEVTGNQLIAIESFNFEIKELVRIRLKVTDSKGDSFEKAFEIEIINVNEAPTDIALAANVIPEHQPPGTTVGELNAEDEDRNESLTFSFTNDNEVDNAFFQIEGNQLLTAETFDFESQNTYEIRVQVIDSESNEFAKSFVINVEDQPDPSIRLEATELEFMPTEVDASAPMSFNVLNEGEATLTLFGMITPEGFSANPESIDIPAGSSQEIIITFSPTEARVYEGEVEINSNAGMVNLQVSGEGTEVTSIDDPSDLSNTIKVFPNPASEVVTVDLSTFNGQAVTLKVANSQGQWTMATTPINASEVSLDVSGWPAGIYMIHLSALQGKALKRFIIQR